MVTTDRPTVVLLPGMLCSARLWADQCAVLASQAEVRTVRLQGKTIGEMVRNVLDLPIRQFSLVGLSLGGIVAMKLAAIAPERVNRLALLSTSAHPPRPAQHTSWNEMSTRAERGEFDSITTDSLIPLLVYPAHQTDAKIRETIISMAREVGPAAFQDQLSAQHSRTDLRPELPTIACPTLICAGERDAMVSISTHEEIATAIPHGTLQVIRESGHLTPIEQPNQASQLLLTWLDQRLSSTGR